MKSELLDILCCPETHQSLTLLSAEKISEINSQIEAGKLKTTAGETISEVLQEGLLREDGKWAYRIREGIPVMLVDEALNLENQ